MVGKLDAALQFQQQALSLRAKRQELLASNIANADTPNYKARDIDFAQALQQAQLGQAGNAVTMAKTASAHLGATTGEILGGVAVQYRNAQQGNIDGNTVDMDVERNQFLDNALRYEAGVTILNAQVRNLLAAIQG